MDEMWERVRDVARGSRFDYELDAKPDDSGGQARVFRGTHRLTGLAIALKKLRSGEDTDNNVARMRREIHYGRTLDHPNVTPVLDSADDSVWFVMPLAKCSLEERRKMLVEDQTRFLRLVRQIAAGLEAAHEQQWVHRDIKPANILRFANADNKHRWAVADWGLGRGPVGETSGFGRTRVGRAYGTEGFAAPELSVDAHGATPACDVYSLGQLIGWVSTGQDPQANVALLPADGPWRGVVRAATRTRPEDRPQSMPDLLRLVDEAFNEPDELTAERAGRLLEDSKRGREHALDEFIRLAENHPTDTELQLDVVPGLTDDQLRACVRYNSAALAHVVQALAATRHDWGRRPYGQADTVIGFLVRVARVAMAQGLLALFEDALDAFCAWDADWDQWEPQRLMRAVLRGAKDDFALSAATALRASPETARHLSDLGNFREVDPRIRAAVAP